MQQRALKLVPDANTALQEFTDRLNQNPEIMRYLEFLERKLHFSKNELKALRQTLLKVFGEKPLPIVHHLTATEVYRDIQRLGMKEFKSQESRQLTSMLKDGHPHISGLVFLKYALDDQGIDKIRARRERVYDALFIILGMLRRAAEEAN